MYIFQTEFSPKDNFQMGILSNWIEREKKILPSIKSSSKVARALRGG